jgi:AmmeMemoRadiSam system protein A
MRDDALGRALVAMARHAIGAELGVPDIDAVSASVDHPALAEPGATFVTLFMQTGLRGCIGTLEARRPLGVDVRANAAAAAFSDPRFPPLSKSEFPETRVEVSLLSAPEPIAAQSARSLLEALRPGIDGLVLDYAGRRATFLPQVWESLPDPGDFLAELKRKAGLPADFWHSAIKASRYGVTKWREDDFRTEEMTP